MRLSFCKIGLFNLKTYLQGAVPRRPRVPMPTAPAHQNLVPQPTRVSRRVKKAPVRYGFEAETAD